MAALSWVSLTKVVARACPFNSTKDMELNLLPEIVMVKPDPPATTLAGAMDVIAVVGDVTPHPTVAIAVSDKQTRPKRCIWFLSRRKVLLFPLCF